MTTHPLHLYVAKQLAVQLKRHVVVWYDERGELQPFIDEVRGGPRTSSEPVTVTIDGIRTHLAEYAGSMFELRAAVEPLVREDEPKPVVLYLPKGIHAPKASVLMELEKAGTLWDPDLAQLARNALLQKYTLGVVDEMLAVDRNLSYQDVARALAGGSGAEPPSILKGIFHEAIGSDALLTAWLARDARDTEIATKSATPELAKLVKARLGLELPTDAALAKHRAIVLRYVLANEFRLDLSCAAPASLDAIAKPSSEVEETALRVIARSLRTGHPDSYAPLADRVEAELGLANAKIPSGALGAIDTFRFEERALLRHASQLIADGKFEAALALVAEREQSFWLDRDVGRRGQWEAARRMAELGNVAEQVRTAIGKMSGDAAAWVAAYKDGWFRIDQAQRRLEAWRLDFDEESEERALALVRRAYEDALFAMCEGFTKVLVKAGWTIPGVLHQTRIWSDVVAAQPKPVAYFLVDAMRFEMGAELAARLPETSEVVLRAAVCALPSITPVGMAALMPGASASFSVVEQSAKLGALIDDSFLPDLPSRKKLAAARVPGLVDLKLDELMDLQGSKLRKKLDGAQVVIVRSTEIDRFGEGEMQQARAVMDTVIDNLDRAIRKLASAGVEHAVVSADHGHIYLAADRDESMRTDAPGGDVVDIHRRCWIGRGGATPRGTVRVTAAALGYNSDLDFVFPASGVLTTKGGGLAFHHGGASLQELVIPVLAVRTKAVQPARSTASTVDVVGSPETITNRLFSVTLTLGNKQMTLGATGIQVRPVLVTGSKQVGALGMAVDAQFDRATGCVTLEPGKPATVVVMLNDEVASLRIVVQDPTTDAELFRSPADIPVRLGV